MLREAYLRQPALYSDANVILSLADGVAAPGSVDVIIWKSQRKIPFSAGTDNRALELSERIVSVHLCNYIGCGIPTCPRRT